MINANPAKARQGDAGGFAPNRIYSAAMRRNGTLLDTARLCRLAEMEKPELAPKTRAEFLNLSCALQETRLNGFAPKGEAGEKISAMITLEYAMRAQKKTFAQKVSGAFKNMRNRLYDAGQSISAMARDAMDTARAEGKAFALIIALAGKAMAGFASEYLVRPAAKTLIMAAKIVGVAAGCAGGFAASVLAMDFFDLESSKPYGQLDSATRWLGANAPLEFIGVTALALVAIGSAYLLPKLARQRQF